MYIKALPSKKPPNPRNPRNPRNPSEQNKVKIVTLEQRKPMCFEIPFLEDRLFTDDLWFSKAGIIPHVESHRPVVKRRVLRGKGQARNSSGNLVYRSVRESRIQATKNSYTPVIKTRSQIKRQTSLTNPLPIPTSSPSPIPLSTSNLIPHPGPHPSPHPNPHPSPHPNPNKFISIKQTIIRQMSDIPEYARNIMKPCKIEAMTISERPSTARKYSAGRSGLRGRKSQRSERVSGGRGLGEGKEEFFSSLFRSSNKIQPWGQQEQQFTIY